LKYTVEQRVAQFGPAVRERLAPSFAAVGLEFPPRAVALVAFKDSKHLELYGRANHSAAWTFVKRYGVFGASGRLGPKLAEGDRQVPEGLYRAELLNANSRFHLSIRLNYPNDFDRVVGASDGRTNLGSDIMIHGGASSVGCLAVGDEAAEELFILVALTGIDRTSIVVSPTDFRNARAHEPDVPQPWAAQLYADLRAALAEYPQPSAAIAAR
jgi:murein L,D-transpeptidase YafK